MAGSVRSFVALSLPATNVAALERHVAECAQVAPGFRWIETEAIHLTLRFLGSLVPETLDRVRAELSSVRAAPFSLALGGRGTFGPRSAPLVVWIGLAEGQDACAALAERVEAACGRAGLDPEARSWRAHVTLARARKEGERLPALPDPPPLEPWTVEDFALYESRLRQRPRYVPLQRYSLTGPA